MKLFYTCFLSLSMSCAVVASEGPDSFEAGSVTPEKTLVREYGVFGVVGDAGGIEVVQGHAKTGKKAFRLIGEKSEVKLTLNAPLEKETMLRFEAQRWTGAKPFKFVIEAEVQGKKKTESVYNGNKLPTGKYTSVNHLILKPGTTALIFKMESFWDDAKKSGGVLIDDFQLVALGDMNVTAVEVNQAPIPMLVGNAQNDLLTLNIQTHGAQKPVSLENLTFTFNGTTQLSDIEGVSIYADEKLLAQSAVKGAKAELTLNVPLKHGENVFKVRPILAPNIDLSHRFDAQCVGVKFSNDDYTGGIVVKTDAEPLRAGLDLGPFKEDHCHTFRIPGMVRTMKGTLVAVWDNRYLNSGDLQGHIDIGMRRSTDGGKTWSPLQVVMDMGKYGGEPENRNGVTDPCILVDESNNTLMVVALWMHKKGGHTWGASEAGMEIGKTGQLMLVKSTDDGHTWSKPENLTPQLKKPEWRLFFQGPGSGITMKNGTIVFPAQFRDADGTPFSTLIYSTDHGVSWKVGKGAQSNTTEAQVAELSDGSIMLNMRDNRGGFRSIFVTKDMGETWTAHPTNRKGLCDPVCMGSLIRWAPKAEQGKHTLLFSNPNTGWGRKHLSIRASLDDGETWLPENQLLYDPRDSYGYSCLAPIDDDTVGVLYEGRGHMYFLRIPINEIIKKR